MANLDERITLLENVIRDNFLRQIEIIRDLANEADLDFPHRGDFYITAGLLVCVGIDTLTGYRFGVDSNQERFINFLEEYFPEFLKVVPGHNIRYSHALYKIFRCGLVHSLFLGNIDLPDIKGRFAAGQLDQHVWFDVQTGELIINLPWFIQAFQEASNNYFTSLRDPQNVELRTHFETRFNQLRNI